MHVRLAGVRVKSRGGALVMPAEMTVIPRVPIAQVGTWAASTGEWEATRQQFEDAVLAAADPTCPRPRIWINHDDERIETGVSPVAACGWLSGLSITEDHGGTLIADFNVPKTLADEMPFAFPGRSIEGKTNITATSGRRYGLVLDGVALLGKDIPAVTPLPDMAEVLGMVEPREPVAASGAESPRLIVCALSGAATPASTAGPVNQRPEADMADDATDTTAETASGSTEAAVDETTSTTEATETASTDTTTERDAADTTSSGLVIPEGFELVESTTLAEMQAQLAEVPDLVLEKRKREAAEYFAPLVDKKKSIAASAVPVLTERYVKDPEGTRAICDVLPPNMFQPPPTGRVAATRTAEETDDGELMPSLITLTPAERRRAGKED